MRNAGLDEAQTGMKIAGRNINNLRYKDDTILRFRNIAEIIQIFNSWDLVFLLLCSCHAVRKMGKCIQIIQSI